MENKSIVEYLELVKEQICNLTSINDFFEALCDELHDYSENNPNCTLNEIINVFGTPDDVAKEFLLSSDNFKPTQIAKTKRRWTIFIIGLIVLLVTGSVYMIKIHNQTQAAATDVITISE